MGEAIFLYRAIMAKACYGNLISLPSKNEFLRCVDSSLQTLEFKNFKSFANKSD